MISIVLLLAVQAAVSPSATNANSGDDKVLCRLETAANSHIPNRVCLPKSEWARIEKENSEDVASSRNGRAGGLNGTVINYKNGEMTIGRPIPPGTRPPR